MAATPGASRGYRSRLTGRLPLHHRPDLRCLTALVADDLDDLVLGKLSALYERVKAKVTGESFAGQALERLEQEPENPRRKGAFEAALAEVVHGARPSRPRCLVIVPLLLSGWSRFGRRAHAPG
jgi:hypothetical protein